MLESQNIEYSKSMTRQQLLEQLQETLPRNPVLAKFFRVAKLCESAGYGFDKMLQWKKQTGNEVLFETTVDKTKFTFMLDTTNAIREEQADIIGVSKSAINQQIIKMRKSGIIRREGADKGGKWVIIKPA